MKEPESLNEVEQILDIRRAAQLAALEREYIDRVDKIEREYKRRIAALNKARSIIRVALAIVRVFGKKQKKGSLPMVGGGTLGRPEIVSPRRKDIDQKNINLN